MKKFEFFCAVMVTNALVAFAVALVALTVVRVTGLPGFMDKSLVSSPDGLIWVNMNGMAPFDPEIRKLPIVVGRAQVFFFTMWGVAAIAIPVIFVFIDRYLYAITLGAQRRRWEQQRLMDEKTTEIMRLWRSG